MLRYTAYVEALRDYNIPLDNDLIVEGNFDYRFGGKAVDILRERTNLEFDALVCANDNMALGVIQKLAGYGCNVPEKIALVGFDDIPAARYLNPPLTTIRQPFREMAEQAFEMLIALIKGKPVQEKVFLPARLIIRESCGCLSYAVNQIGSSIEWVKNGEPRDAAADTRSIMTKAIVADLVLPEKRKNFMQLAR